MRVRIRLIHFEAVMASSVYTDDQHVLNENKSLSVLWRKHCLTSSDVVFSSVVGATGADGISWMVYDSHYIHLTHTA